MLLSDCSVHVSATHKNRGLQQKAEIEMLKRVWCQWFSRVLWQTVIDIKQKSSTYSPHILDVILDNLCCVLAALWGYRMWEWLHRSGRGVWLWGPNGKHLFFRNPTSIQTIAKHNIWLTFLVCVHIFDLLMQECYKDCCKKCSLSNGAHCSDGPCCNGTCLVRHFAFASLFIITSSILS